METEGDCLMTTEILLQDSAPAYLTDFKHIAMYSYET